MGRPAKSESRDTRHEILEAALDLFASNGYSGTSMRQIAHAVGVRESALYHHFPAKEAILDHLSREAGPARADSLASFDFDQELKDGLSSCMRRLGHQILESWATPRAQKFARMMMAEGLRLQSERMSPHTFIEQAHERLTQFFEELGRRGLVKKLAPRIMAWEWIGPLVALRMSHLMMNPGHFDMRKLRQVVDHHVDFFVQAIEQ